MYLIQGNVRFSSCRNVGKAEARQVRLSVREAKQQWRQQLWKRLPAWFGRCHSVKAISDWHVK